MNTETNYGATFYSEVENDAAVLEKNVTDYPASSVARFLLLYHYKKNNDPRFEELAKQTAIYLHDPLWTQFQLSRSDENGNIFLAKESTIKTNSDAETIKKSDILIEGDLSENAINKEPVSTVNEQISENLILPSPPSEEATDQTAQETINSESIDRADVENTPAENNNELFVPTKNKTPEENLAIEDALTPVNEQISENLILPSPPSDQRTDQTAQEITDSESIHAADVENTPAENNNEPFLAKEDKTLEEDLAIEDVPPPVNEQTSENFILGIERLDEKRENSENEAHDTDLAGEGLFVNTTTEDTKNDVPSETEEEINLNQTASTEKYTDASLKDEPDESSNNDSQSDDDAETDNEDSELPFEPLHTVDYFASQGIKIPEEALENDMLGKQVKSFTAWLKTMKKLHPGQLPEQNEVIERIIQTSSEVSNQNVNVLTEAMAEVLVKQGKQEKAIEMYQKLSLLNPSKSAYFAAKIESLKII